MPRAALPELRASLRIISTRLSAGEPVIHVYSEAPPRDGIAEVEPRLEDVYFYRVGSAAGDA